MTFICLRFSSIQISFLCFFLRDVRYFLNRRSVSSGSSHCDKPSFSKLKGVHIPTNNSLFTYLELKIDVVIRSGISKIPINSGMRVGEETVVCCNVLWTFIMNVSLLTLTPWTRRFAVIALPVKKLPVIY